VHWIAWGTRNAAKDADQAVTAGLADRVETLADAVHRVASEEGRAALDRRRDLNPPVHSDPAGGDTRPVNYTPDERTRLLAVMTA